MRSILVSLGALALVLVASPAAAQQQTCTVIIQGTATTMSCSSIPANATSNCASYPAGPYGPGPQSGVCLPFDAPPFPCPIDVCTKAQSEGSAVGCQACTYTVVTLPSPVWLSQGTKNQLNVLATTLNATAALTIGYAAACAAAGPGAPLCASWLGTAAILQAATAGVVTLIVVIDPPDADYTEVVTVVPEPFTPAVMDCNGKSSSAAAARHRSPRSCNLTQAEADELNALFGTWAEAIGVMRAMVTTTNRGNTAAAAGDQASLDLQVAAFRAFQTQLAGLYAAEVSLRTTLAPMLLENGRPWLDAFSGLLSDPNVLTLLQQLATGVLP